MLVITPFVQAAPVTGAVTAIGNNNATFNAAGAASPAWFVWGLYSGKLYLKTKNVTATGGVATVTVKDYPFYGNTKFYVQACDSTGCGAEVFFTTLPVTPLPITTYGETFVNLTESNFDISYLPYNSVKPYTWVLPTEPEGIGITIITGLLITAIFLGMWIRGKNTVVPAFAGALISALFVYSNTGLQLGIPPEILGIGQGVFAASIAGLIMSLFKKG